MQRMHNPEREAKKADRIHRTKSLKQKEPSTDFESFMFKCRLCMMGFRRRGMLVITLTTYYNLFNILLDIANLICLLIFFKKPAFFITLLQVNHLSKRHPEMRIEEVPELTLPIIKPNRDYFCQYCDKVCTICIDIAVSSIQLH